MQKSERRGFLNAFHLKLLAMATMLCSHMQGTVIMGDSWLYSIGRLAFPIFAFQIVEGFFHTKDFKKYLLRMFIFALISELPFNLIAGGGWLYPFHQNVMFTFCISLLLMNWIENARDMPKWQYVLRVTASLIGGYFLGFITFVDYFGYGILMVLVFYLFRNIRFGRVAVLICMVYINCFMIGGLVYPITLFGRVIEISQQGFAVLALIPIWLYNGKHGPRSKVIQYACYAFYPLHMAILAVLMRLM